MEIENLKEKSDCEIYGIDTALRNELFEWLKSKGLTVRKAMVLLGTTREEIQVASQKEKL